MYQDDTNRKSSEFIVPENWNDGKITAYEDLPDFIKGFGGCKVCRKGTFNPFWGQATCFGCPKGTEGITFANNVLNRVTIDSACKTCAVGKYQDVIGSADCKSCSETMLSINLVIGQPTCSTSDETCSGKGTFDPYPSCICECDAGHRPIGNTQCNTVFNPCWSNTGNANGNKAEEYCKNGATCRVVGGQARCDCVQSYSECSYRPSNCPEYVGSKTIGDRCSEIETKVQPCCVNPGSGNTNSGGGTSGGGFWQTFGNAISTINQGPILFAKHKVFNNETYQHVGKGRYVLKRIKTKLKASTVHGVLGCGNESINCALQYPSLSQRPVDTENSTYWSSDNNNVDYIKTKSILTYSPTWQQHNNINDCYSVCVRGNKYDGTITWTNTDITTNYFELNNTEWISNKTKNPYKYINATELRAEYFEEAFDGMLQEQTPNYDETKCVACSEGRYSDNEYESTCKACPTGKSNQYNSSHTINSCFDCAIGQYQDVEGQTSCKSCPSDSTSVKGSNDISKCKCNNGDMIAVSGREMCVCKDGKVRNPARPWECMSCDDLNECPDYPAPCSVGQYCEDYEIKDCVLLLETHYCVKNKKTPCPSGYRCNSGSKFLCPIGHKCTGDGTKTECPIGHYQNEEGKASCKTCDNYREYQNEAGKESCKSCPDEYFSISLTTCDVKDCKQCEEKTEQMYYGSANTITRCECPHGLTPGPPAPLMFRLCPDEGSLHGTSQCGVHSSIYQEVKDKYVSGEWQNI